jgi:mRNA-degrading endonuclease RelE of RelBE toxin-antitoxin system
MIATEKIPRKWKTKFTQTAEKQFEKLDKSIRQTVKQYIIERLETELNPKRFGKPLVGNLKEF